MTNNYSETHENNMSKNNMHKYNIPISFYDDSSKYVIYCDLCGVNKSDIDVTLKGRVLAIKAKRDFGLNTGFKLSELAAGELFRLIELNEDVDVDSIVAEYNEGMLKITIQKLKSHDAVKIAIK